MISVVIPLYNKAQSIVQTIYSVLTQSFQHFEVIVVDDGSTDDSVNKLKSVADNRIRLIQKTNGGVSSARNMGISLAKYEYIAFLDADDFWEPNYLEEQVKLIRDFPEAVMWGCGCGRIEDNNKISNNYSLPLEFRDVIVEYWSQNLYLFTSISVIIHKRVFSLIGVFDERMNYGEDLDMWYRIILNFPVAFCNTTLAYYKLDAENRAMNKIIPLNEHLPYFIEKYAEYRKNNSDFRHYFDRECLHRLFPYFLKKRNVEDLQRILSHINFSEYKFSFRFRFRFPKLYYYYTKLINIRI